MKNERDISPLDFIPQLTLEPIVVPPRRRPKKRLMRSPNRPEPEPKEEERDLEGFRVDETMEHHKPKKHKHE